MPQSTLDPVTLARALKAFSAAVGAKNVFSTPEDQSTYSDHFAADDTVHRPAAAVAPASAEEVQAIVRIANEHRIPLWPISRGKNFGYGGPAPVLKGSVVLDLTRMKRIEVDEENGTVLVEPGVGFFDLYDYLQVHRIPLWLSVPGNSWGSVVGNALDRGVGYTPYGDHAARICGLEVVLPDGDVVRTGMGAMAGSKTWQLYKPGFGPSWDTLFCQSNFGIVTKLGLWLMPEPESVLGLDFEFDKPEDIGWAVDVLAPLRRNGLIQQSPSFGNWMRAAAVMTRREQWAKPDQPLDEGVITAIRRHFNIGWWSISIRTYGALDVNEATIRHIRSAFDGKPVLAIKPARWLRGDPPLGSPEVGTPISFPLANSNWFSGRGGHVSFSPVLPPRGDLALQQFQRTHALYEKYGMDYHASFSMGERSMTNVNQVLFDRDNPVMAGNVDRIFRALVADGMAHGYGEYRTHIEYMDLVASTYDFNHQALRRLNERVKDALDPHGVLAPGKSGIWPARLRGERA
jgi:4-cresol dehydrogenase (hydroxylating) flavoprotein subunit